jgi:aldehyde:ferredoxin oxidoreductase
MKGLTGKALYVNLTKGKCVVEDIPEEWARDYIGGRGLAAKYLYERMNPKADPLGPKNLLIFATGPLTGTSVSSASRYMVVTKGALTGAITTSNSGGHWGPELKFAGYDLVMIDGKASQPSYIFIYDDLVEIREANDLWGMGVSDTEDTLRERMGIPDLRIASIGPAGENLCKFACIMNDKHRAAGRSGVGAVMGSKNLKAIAVRGTGGISVAKPAEFVRGSWELAKLLAGDDGIKQMGEYGTIATVDLTNTTGGLPTNNFQMGQFEGASKINGEALNASRLVRNKSCFACNIACGRVSRLGPEANQYTVNYHPRNWKTAGEGLEYENAWSLGADVGVSDLDALLRANFLCNDLGMDPISMGSTLAAAMELYQNGIIDADVTGMPLDFGNGEALVRMTEATAYREGFGNELADGALRMTTKYGHPEFFMGSKGQEFPAYDPRAYQAMGVAFATCNRGGCHIRAWTLAGEVLGDLDPHTPEGKGEYVVGLQNVSTVHDATGICLFVGSEGGPLETVHKCLKAATGFDWTWEEFIEVGERTWNIERLYNLKAGFTRKDDTIPKRMLEETQSSGPAAGVTVNLKKMLDDYYSVRGWTKAGKPTTEKLEALGLS